MKHILLIAYFYPPQRGIGGKRIARWARRLHGLGFSPTVLTTPLPPESERDEGQAQDPPEVSVVREYCPEWFWRLYHGTNQSVRAQVGAPAQAERASFVKGALRKIEETVHRYYPVDPKIWFAPFATMRALSLAIKEEIDAVVITSAPYSSLLVGPAFVLLGVPWVADLRDPWSFNFEQRKKAPLMQRIEALLERLILRTAAKVVFASDATRQRYEEIYPWLQGKTKTLYSGFDKDLMPVVSPWPLGERPKKTLIHFGTFYGPRRLGIFIDALAQVIQEKALTPGDFQLLLLGNAAKEDLHRAEELGIREFLVVHPALPYEEGISVLRGADALLYCDPGREKYFVAGKLFDYLRAERPILALSASEEIEGILASHQLGKVCDPDDQRAMVERLSGMIDDPAGGLGYSPRQLEELTAEASAEGLAALLKECVVVSRE